MVFYGDEMSITSTFHTFLPTIHSYVSSITMYSQFLSCKSIEFGSATGPVVNNIDTMEKTLFEFITIQHSIVHQNMTHCNSVCLQPALQFCLQVQLKLNWRFSAFYIHLNPMETFSLHYLNLRRNEMAHVSEKKIVIEIHNDYLLIIYIYFYIAFQLIYLYNQQKSLKLEMIFGCSHLNTFLHLDVFRKKPCTRIQSIYCVRACFHSDISISSLQKVWFPYQIE